MAKSKAVKCTALGFREVAREAILGYVFWTLVFALPPMVWFYPLNEMEISGYEAFAVAMLSPILLEIGPLKQLLETRWGMAVFRVATLAGLASFQAPTTLQRLIILAVGIFFQMLVFTSSLCSSSPKQRTLTCWGTVLGLFAFLSSRVWFVSFVPAWWDMFTNSVIITLAAIANLDKIVSGDDSSSMEKPVTGVLEPRWPLAGLGFGTLMFLTNWIFGDISLITRWTVEPYPDTGPMPYPWGLPVLLALWVGILASSWRGLTSSPLWWLAGMSSLAGLYYLHTWAAYASGLLLGVYTLSLYPEALERLSCCPPGRTFTLAGATSVFFILYEVWTVAYNFVPGGEFTREHTDHLMLIVAIVVGACYYTQRRTSTHKYKTSFISTTNGNMPNRTMSFFLLLIVLGGISGFAWRYPKQHFSHPPKSATNAEFTTAIWTYHFGYDNHGWPSLERGAQLLNNSGADVVTLLESDASKPFLGNNDFGMWLSEKLGVYVDFGPSTRDHTWGNMLFSKYPIVKSSHYLLPSPHGELAPAIFATINFTDHLVDFLVTHMGNDQDVLDRQLQAEMLADLLKNAENPVVFMGYVTSKPGSRDYKKIINSGNMKDIDKTDKDRFCEYIMYRGLTRLGYARVSHGGLSDTEMQVAKFQIPDDPDNYEDNDKVVTDPSQIPENLRFSSAFGTYNHGHNWIWDHRYHMSTPKYFVSRK